MSIQVLNKIDVLVNKKIQSVESAYDWHIDLAPKANDSFYIFVPLDIGNAARALGLTIYKNMNPFN